MSQLFRYGSVCVNQRARVPLMRFEFAQDQVILTVARTSQSNVELGWRCLLDLHIILYNNGVPHSIGADRDTHHFQVIDMLSVSRKNADEILKYATDLMDEAVAGVH